MRYQVPPGIVALLLAVATTAVTSAADSAASSPNELPLLKIDEFQYVGTFVMVYKAVKR